MAEDKNNINDNPTTNNIASEAAISDNEKLDNKESTETKEQEKIPTLAEDYESLKNMHLLRNVMIRMQFGKYPNKKIDEILKRRMNLDESKYQGTDIIRIILSILSSFLICTILYILIWLFATSMGFHELKQQSSLVISLFFLSSCGFFIFNNISVPDEKKLKIAIKEKMNELENELKKEKKTNENNTEKQS
jgi:hypothetical protein